MPIAGENPGVHFETDGKLRQCVSMPNAISIQSRRSYCAIGVARHRGGEGDEVELKANLRTNLHKMHLAVLKTIARFLNAKGVPS
jgi:hypothetical protein